MKEIILLVFISFVLGDFLGTILLINNLEKYKILRKNAIIISFNYYLFLVLILFYKKASFYERLRMFFIKNKRLLYLAFFAKEFEKYSFSFSGQCVNTKKVAKKTATKKVKERNILRRENARKFVAVLLAAT